MTLYTLNNRRLKNDLFSSLLNDFSGTENTLKNNSFPKSNIVETKESFRIELLTPGYKKDSFELKLDKNILTVKGNVEEKKENNEEKYSLHEFSTNGFLRRFSLPKNIDEEKINAKYEDGILSIGIPKKEVEKPEPRAISIS